MSFEFDPYSEAMDADPFPAYAYMREHCPAYFYAPTRMWFLTRYEDVCQAAQNWQIFSSASGNLLDELPGRAGSTLGTTDPPRHDRLRALIQSAFGKKSLDHLVPAATTLAQELCEAILARGQCDFIGDFSSQITVSTLFSLMGLPAADHAPIRQNVMLAISVDKQTRRKAAAHIEGFQALVRYLASAVDARRRDPQDDLISRLTEAQIDGERLTETEVVMTSSTLVMAGIESLSSFMAMLALNLADNPAARRRAATEPGAVTLAMEESLRLNTSAQRFKRVLTTDVELHGQLLRAGEFVACCYGSANRDGRKFEDPDVYDLDRRSSAHLGFGTGKHFCLGTTLARLIAISTMEVFLRRIPEFTLAGPILRWVPSTNFRSPVRLALAVR